MQAVRGKVYNEQRYKQVVDYSGLQFERGITPTDIDGALDFDGKFFVFIELKSGDALIPGGQRRALAVICDSLAIVAHTVVIVARHHTKPEEQIDAAACLVSEVRWRSKWRNPKRPITVRKAIEWFKRIAEQSPLDAGKLIKVEFVEPPDTRLREQSEFPF